MATFIQLPGNTSGEMFRINLDLITKYKKNKDGGTEFFTYMDRNNPYFSTSVPVDKVDKIISEATTPKPKYTLKP